MVSDPSEWADPRGRRASDAYRLTGVGLFVFGVVAGVLSVEGPFVESQRLLLSFAGVGVFGATLLVFLRPGATTEADPRDTVYATLATNADALASDAGLGERRIYAPTTFETAGLTPAALTVPAADRERISIDRNRRPVFDAADGTLPTDPSEATLYPTGAALFEIFEGMVASELSTDPYELAAQLETGVVSGLELAASVESDVDAAGGTATMTVDRPQFGPATQFDHPVASFLAVGFAVGLDVPVVAESEPADDDRTYRLTYQWVPSNVGNADG